MLTEIQIAARRGKLTASRIAVLMRGDVEGILNLWRELTDSPEFVPEDLSRVWAVRLGEATEQLSLDWYAMRGNRVTRRGEVVQHHSLPWAACTLDGFDEDLKCPIECKHVGGREPIEVVIERYQPQMQWQMECSGADQCALSIIIGGAEPRVEFIERDGEYVHQMIIRGDQFMRHVRDRTPPVALPPVAAPIIADKTEDMSNNEVWARHATQWLQVKGAAETARESEKILKALVPDDCKKAFGWGARVTRDRAGRMSLREDVQ